MAEFEFMPLDLQGAYLIVGFSSKDLRGESAKIFEKEIFKLQGIDFKLNETFLSISQKNVIRGMHFQTKEPQAKLVSVLQGRAYDVIVDLRMSSPTYKKWCGFELNGDNHETLFVPKGFAHGCLILDNNTIMLCQCDGEYSKENDTGIRYDDPEIAIEWPIEDVDTVIYSERDGKLPYLKDIQQMLNFS